MNRELKFRAWIDDDVEMSYSNTHDTLGQFFCWLEEEFWDNSYHIMQFTGLKDKNGQEIYEGDILSFPTSNWINREVQVVWYEKQHCWALKNNHGIQHTTSGGRAYLIDGKHLEIIGNIYENPELLK